MQKLYAYVDESGQETQGRIFVVAVIVVTSDQEALKTLCEAIEVATKKGKFKWGKAHNTARLAYLQRIFATPQFHRSLRYALFRNTRKYDDATLEAIARAVKWGQDGEPYTLSVYVDGLSKTKRREYGSRLRKMGVPIKNVQGVLKDENNALTRLADALAGFVRDALEGKSAEIYALYLKAKNDDVVIEV